MPRREFLRTETVNEKHVKIIFIVAYKDFISTVIVGR